MYSYYNNKLSDVIVDGLLHLSFVGSLYVFDFFFGYEPVVILFCFS